MTSISLSTMDPNLIDGVRDQLAQDFAQRVFDAATDVGECLDLEAEASISATEKKRFERASDLLLARRRDLQTHAATVVSRLFDEKLQRLLDGGTRNAMLSLDGMTLLADDRLDEEIAINHCSRRLKEQCDYELWCLTQRIATLVGIAHPADTKNPVFPQTFAQALMEAIGSIENNAAVRLIVFKAFGPVLLEIVPAVFTAANAALMARGIDIDVGDYYGRPVLTPERPSPTAASQHEITAHANLELTAALKKILSRAGQVHPETEAERDTASATRALATTMKLPAYNREEAVEPAWRGALHDIEAVNAHIVEHKATNVRTLHVARRALQDKLTRDEQVVSDIVTVMFDRLLIDSRMPVELRDVVARLQLPVLELALDDRSLLTQVHHPVRKFIDLVAEFGLTLGLDDDDESTVRSVENIIDGLLLSHRKLPDAFQLALNQLDGFYYHHEEAALQTDAKLRALERDEAAEFAGSQADREIALRLQNRALAEPIIAFVLTAWRAVLIHDYLRGGASGQPWKLALATIDDLVKSVHPAAEKANLQRLTTTLPATIELLLTRPDIIGDHSLIAADLFAELRRSHALAIAGKWTEIGGRVVTPSLDVLSAPREVVSPSASLAALGMACGDWIETRDDGIRRWRLNWITTILGTCVFKHYESGTTCNMRCDELAERLESGSVQRVRGLGLADEVLSNAFETVSRKVRHDGSVLAARSIGKSRALPPSPVAPDYAANELKLPMRRA